MASIARYQIGRALAFAVTLAAPACVPAADAQQAPADSAQQIRQLALEADDDLHHQKLAEAAAAYRSILALDPDNVSAHSNLGLTYYMQADFPRAVEEFQIVLRRQPDLWNIVALCGLSEAQSGKNEQAIAHLSQALEQVRESSLRMATGKKLFAILMETGNVNRAAVVIEQLKQIDPGNADVLYAAHQVYSLLAHQAFLALAQTAPDSARMYQLQADEMAQVGNVPGAIVAYRRAIALDPHLSGVHLALGEALSASHSSADQAQAEAEYNKALADNPQDEKAECRLGFIEVRRSAWPAASVDFRRALQLEPGDPQANEGLGIVLMSTGSNAEAVTWLSRAVQADPLDASAWYHLSLAARNAGDREAAARAMQQFQKLKTKSDELERNFQSVRSASAKPSREVNPPLPGAASH